LFSDLLVICFPIIGTICIKQIFPALAVGPRSGPFMRRRGAVSVLLVNHGVCLDLV
jgi:hypothetical protein